MSPLWSGFFVTISFQPKLYIGMCTNGIFLCHGEGGGGNFLYTTHYINITKNECMNICKGVIQTRYYLICFMYYERLNLRTSINQLVVRFCIGISIVSKYIWLYYYYRYILKIETKPIKFPSYKSPDSDIWMILKY